MNFSNQMTTTWCVGGRQYSNTNSLSACEKRDPKTKKMVKVTKGNCSNCGRAESQILTK